jgi:hypothetical protein
MPDCLLHATWSVRHPTLLEKLLRQIFVTLVANQLLRVPGSRFIRALQVPAGLDAADQEIVRLVITVDIGGGTLDEYPNSF